MKSRIISCSFVVLCIGVLFAGMLGTVLKPDIRKSDLENRYLSQYEPPTAATVLDGSWFNFLETYSKDQFFVRDSALKAYNLFLDSLCVRERNGYILGVDSFIMPVNSFYPSTADASYGDAQVAAMKLFASAADTYGGTVIYLNAPHKNEMFPEKYPALYSNQEKNHTAQRASIIEKAKAAGISVVETYDLLVSHKDDYIYYATDHHWTVRGAYYAYQELLEHISELEGNQKLCFPALDELDSQRSPRRMAGSYLRTFGDSGLINVDYMEYLIPEDMPEYTRYDNGEISKRALYNANYSNYSSFMGGDIGNTVIETNRNELPSVLFIGLSYSNPLEFFSVYNFDRVESIDPRHWSGSICQYIKQSQPDYIVVVRDDIYEGRPGNTCTME